MIDEILEIIGTALLVLAAGLVIMLTAGIAAVRLGVL